MKIIIAIGLNNLSVCINPIQTGTDPCKFHIVNLYCKSFYTLEKDAVETFLYPDA